MQSDSHASNSAVFLLILILHAAITSLATPIVAKLQTVYVVLNVLYVLFSSIFDSALKVTICHDFPGYVLQLLLLFPQLLRPSSRTVHLMPSPAL